MTSGRGRRDEIDGQARVPEEVPGLAEHLLNAARGQRLAEIRRARGLTQRHLAEKMGVSPHHVCEIERGTIADREALARYALALGGRLRQTIHFDDGDIAVVE